MRVAILLVPLLFLLLLPTIGLAQADAVIQLENRERIIKVEEQVSNIEQDIEEIKTTTKDTNSMLTNVQVWTLLIGAGLGIGQILVARKAGNGS